MARLDLYRIAGIDGYLLEVQANLLSALGTTMVVPLLPIERSPTPMKILNPIFEIAGAQHVLATQYLASVPRQELGDPVAILGEQNYYQVGNALDLLLSGS